MTPVPSRLLTALVVSTTLLAPVSSSNAKDLNGRFGVGIEQSLGGASGLTMRYFVSDAVGMALTLGADFTFSDDETVDVNKYFTSVGVAWDFARSLHAHLGLGLRVALGISSDDSTPQVAVELPLALTFFLSDHFSVGVSTGILLNIVPADGPQLDPDGHGGTTSPDSVGLGFGAGSVTGTLSVLYYF